MADHPISRSPSEVLKRGYTDDEVHHIYELGRIFLEGGQLKKAEAIFTGLTEIASDFAPAWLGLSYICFQEKAYDNAADAARAALQIDPECVEAMLYLIAYFLIVGDSNSAGTYLGEVGERVESGAVDNPDVIRFFRIQLARYEAANP